MEKHASESAFILFNYVEIKLLFNLVNTALKNHKYSLDTNPMLTNKYLPGGLLFI